MPHPNGVDSLLGGYFLTIKLNEYEDKCNFQEWCELGV